MLWWWWLAGWLEGWTIFGAFEACWLVVQLTPYICTTPDLLGLAFSFPFYPGYCVVVDSFSFSLFFFWDSLPQIPSPDSQTHIPRGYTDIIGHDHNGQGILQGRGVVA